MVMNMNKIQFEVLRLIEERKIYDVNLFKEELFKTAEEIENAYNFLLKFNYVFNNKITENGKEKLNEYRVDNAIILAAGMATRFVPLSYEIPKGLLKVKGIPLIERQILQLKERGIDKIIIVVGYMKECFEYLKDKYNVILVESKEYKTRNNHSSVYAAKDYLKRSIITSSDLYFENNIFQKYAYDSYYCALFERGKTSERGLKLNNDDLILETFYGERAVDVWVTLGYAFFSNDFSKTIIKYIEKDYNDIEIINKFWADIQDEHLSELYMYAKKCKDNIIYEFDSLEELREFDDTYIYNSNSKIMKEICNILNVTEEEIVNIKPLRKLKNTFFKFNVKNKEYICNVDASSIEKIEYDSKNYIKILSKNEGNVNLYERK